MQNPILSGYRTPKVMNWMVHQYLTFDTGKSM